MVNLLRMGMGRFLCWGGSAVFLVIIAKKGLSAVASKAYENYEDWRDQRDPRLELRRRMGQAAAVKIPKGEPSPIRVGDRVEQMQRMEAVSRYSRQQDKYVPSAFQPNKGTVDRNGPSHRRIFLSESEGYSITTGSAPADSDTD